MPYLGAAPAARQGWEVKSGERGTPRGVPTVGNSAQSCQVLRGPCCGERAPELSWSRGRAARLSFPTPSLRRQRGCFQGTGSREPVWPGAVRPARQVRPWVADSIHPIPTWNQGLGRRFGTSHAGSRRACGARGAGRWPASAHEGHARAEELVKGHVKPQWSGLNPSPSQP